MLFYLRLLLYLIHSDAYSSISHSDTNREEHFPSFWERNVFKQYPKAAQLEISLGTRNECQRTHLILICPQAHRFQGVVCFYFAWLYVCQAQNLCVQAEVGEFKILKC